MNSYLESIKRGIAKAIRSSARERKDIAIYVDESPNFNQQAFFIECTNVDSSKKGTICDAIISFDVTYIPAETKDYRSEFDYWKMFFYTDFYVVNAEDRCYNVINKKIQEVDRLLHILFDVKVTYYIKPEVESPMEELENGIFTR